MGFRLVGRAQGGKWRDGATVPLLIVGLAAEAGACGACESKVLVQPEASSCAHYRHREFHTA